MNHDRDAACPETVGAAVAAVLAGKMTEEIFVATLCQEGVVTVEEAVHIEFSAEFGCVHFWVDGAVFAADLAGEIEAF